MSKSENRLATTVRRIRNASGPFQQQAVSLALGRTVKFVGTAGLKVEELSRSAAR
jgi:hypothetical protein